MRLSAIIATVAASWVVTQAEEQIVLSNGEDEATAPVNVAIIGAGAAGASSAYHLAQFAATSGVLVNITIFERNDYIGGRSTTVDAYNNSVYPVELGASIFVKVNQILASAVDEFNLSTAGMIFGTESIPGAALGVWDGKDFVVTQTGDDLTWWDTAKFLWRYGLAPVRTMNLMKSTVGKFLKMYDDPLFPFASLTQVVEKVGLLDATGSTGEQYLKDNGIAGAFGHDVVQASTRVNYAQNLKYINGLLSMVCMATDGAMSVDGGNWQIFDHMVAAANATVKLGTSVAALARQRNGQYTLEYRPASDYDTKDFRAQSFDAVILAAPYQYADVDVKTSLRHAPDKIAYVELHVTLLTSPHLLSPAFFGMPAGEAAPKVILTTLSPDEHPKEGAAGVGNPGFFSISLLSPVANPKTGAYEYLYKIFSPSPPNSTFLAHLLGIEHSHFQEDVTISEEDISWMYRKVWNSYPYEIPREAFESVQLDDGVWYTSGIEGFISTMETSALMGKNVARLVADHWQQKLVNIAGMREPSVLSQTTAM